MSFGTVLVTAAQNAFNDNVIKFVIMGLALAVIGDTQLGENIAVIMSGILLIPFIFLAPVAGFVSDRFSKRSVIIGCMFSQVAIFTFIAFAISLKSVRLAIFGFFLLSVQSAFFGPAKLGILKELVGSKKLGMVAGWMQMATMLAILGGFLLGGRWFSILVDAGKSPWEAAIIPILAIGAASLVALFIAFVIQKTPNHSDLKFSPAVLTNHFTHLAEMMRERPLRLASLGIGYFWLLSNTLGLVLVEMGSFLHPDLTDGKGIAATANMTAMIGIGLMVGSLAVSLLSRNGINLRLIPIGGVGFIVALLTAGLTPAGSWGSFLGLALVGFFGGFFLVPLSAYLQDVCDPASRGRVLSASGLLNALAGIVSLGIVLGLKALGFSPVQQILAMTIPTLFAVWIGFRIATQPKP